MAITGNSSIDLSVTNVWRSYRAFRAGKKPSRAIMEFEANLENNLLLLCRDLHTDRYKHSDYDHKIVNEKKRRDIYVASVRDRVVHRLLYDFLSSKVDRRLDYDVWSCRQGKGLHGALKRTQFLLQKHPTAWIWRADIQKFFDSVPHDLLLETVNNQVACLKAKKLLGIVISSYNCVASQPASQPALRLALLAQGKPAVGLPIGNLTSQILSNIYLDRYDQFIRHRLKPLAYVRYGDDFLIFSNRQCDSVRLRRLACLQLSQMGLELHTRQDVIVRAWQGLHFLGHNISNSSILVEPKIERSVVQNINLRNIASYSSLKLRPQTIRKLAWHINLEAADLNEAC